MQGSSKERQHFLESTQKDEEKDAMQLLLQIRQDASPIHSNTTFQKRKFEEMSKEDLKRICCADGSVENVSTSKQNEHIEQEIVIKRSHTELYILQLYQPKFYQLYCEYEQFLALSSRSISITPSSHVLSLCLEHLISFSCWIRKTPGKVQAIKVLFDDNPDLRPEVRNGLTMLLVYTFCAALANLRHHKDLFLVLQNNHKGLGIANRTSLRIYSDPFHFFYFIKHCLSGLIDAGRIPENERINTVKKGKSTPENQEEIMAYEQIQQSLLLLLEKEEETSGGGGMMMPIEEVKQKVASITNYWQAHQEVKTRRFAAVLPFIATSSTPSQKMIDSAVIIHRPAIAIPAPVIRTTSSENEQEKTAEIHLSPTASSTNSTANSTNLTRKAPIASTTTTIAAVIRPNTTANNNNTTTVLEMSSFSFLLYRFNRISAAHWTITVFPVYSLHSLFLTLPERAPVFLLDETKLLSSVEMQSKHFYATKESNKKEQQGQGFITLEKELNDRQAVVTSWTWKDREHCQDFLSQACATTVTSSSLLDYWWKVTSPLISGLPNPSGRGVLAYERMVQVGLVLRKEEGLLGLVEDCWQWIYVGDLPFLCLQYPRLDQFFLHLFPQLLKKLPSDSHTMITVLYYGHRLPSSSILATKHSPPEVAPVQNYETIGLLSDSSSTLLSRFLTEEEIFHDFLFQRL